MTERINRIKSAFREATEISIIRTKMRLECYLCNSNAGLRRCHHNPPFIVLFNDFIEKNEITDVELYKEDAEWHIKDEKLLAKWMDYHEKKSVIDSLCKACFEKHVSDTFATHNSKYATKLFKKKELKNTITSI